MVKRTIYISQPVTGEEEWQAIKDPIMSGWLTAGPRDREFEEQFAERHKVKHAIAVTSATTALHLALVALEIKPGDEVIVPAFTWVATANVVEYCGAKVVFADIDPKTFNLDPKSVASLITGNTRAIIAVHLFGYCADMQALKNVAGDIPIVEDAACAAGAALNGVPAGGLGDIGCFSFHPRKSVTTGEGGMITTNNENYAEVMGMLRNHGASLSEEQRHHGPRPYFLPEFNLLGYNYRMTDLQGAVGCVQLSKLDTFIQERASWAKFYQEELKDIDWIQLPVEEEGYKHGWQSFATLIDETRSPMTRNQLMEYLQDNGVSTRPGTHAVHMLGYYAEKYGLQPSDFTGAELANNCSMAIPLHNRMVKEDYEYVVHLLKSIRNGI